MEKLLFKSILFCCLTVLVFSFFDSFFEKPHPFKETLKEYEQYHKDNLSILFFGNSHSYSSFDPRIFEIELGVNSMNIASAGQRLITTSVVAEKVLKETTPELAVVNLFSASFNEPKNEEYKAINLLALDYLPFSWSKARVISETFSINEWPSAFSETIRLHHNWPYLDSINKLNVFRPIDDHYMGFQTRRNRYDATTETFFNKKYEKMDSVVLALSNTEKKRINTLFTLFKENNVPVLFINVPSDGYDKSQFYKTHAIAVSKYMKEIGATYLEMNSIKNDIPFTKNDYRNPNHLNTNGSIKASLFLSNYIKDSLKVIFNKRKINLSGNRYSQLYSKKNVLFQKEIDAAMTERLFGIKEVILYKINKNRYELLFPLVSDTLGFQKVRLEHDATPEEIRNYGTQKIFFNKDTTKVVFWGTLSNSNVLHYKDKSFAVFYFKTPLEKLRNLSFHAGNNRSVNVFSIDTLSTSK